MQCKATFSPTTISSKPLGVRFLSCSTRPLQAFTFEPGDFVVIRDRGGKQIKRKLVGPLKASSTFGTAYGGRLAHDDIIGRHPRDAIAAATSPSARSITVHRPSLEEFIALYPRKLTPIYERDGTAIANALLELRPGDKVLEAGTGTGSMSLRLARAIFDGKNGSEGRVDSVDRKTHQQGEARTFIDAYDRGIYGPYVRLFDSGLESFFEAHEQQRTEPPFLYDAALLDLPNAHRQLEQICKHIKLDARVVTYCPNLTQIIACARAAKSMSECAFALDECIDITWRNWVIRAVGEPVKQVSENVADQSSGTAKHGPDEDDFSSRSSNEIDKWICRPENFSGNSFTAFLAVFRRVR